MNRGTFIHELVSKLKTLALQINDTPSRTELTEFGVSDYQIRLAGGYETLLKMAGMESRRNRPRKEEGGDEPPPIPEAGPKILIFDIETSPMELYGYGLFDQNFGLAQIKKDWFTLSWAAKWFGAPEHEVMYADVKDEPDLSNDYGIISQIWQLLDEADIVVTQNGVRFDAKKLNAKFVQHGFGPPSPYRHIDTFRIGKKYFGFTSYKLEYMTNLLCKKYKKLTHSKFAGFELWKECLLRNPEAWAEMEKYNRYDVLSLEELYTILRPFDRTINFNVYYESLDPICSCGSKDVKLSGYDYTNASKREVHTCGACGAHWLGRFNLLSKEKRKSLLK